MLDDKKQTAKEIKQEVEKTAQQAIQALKRIAKIIKGTVVAIKNPVTWIIAGIIILVIALIGMTQVLGKNEVGHICVYTDENGKQQKVDLNQPDNANSNDKDADKKGPTAKDSKGKCDRIGWGKQEQQVDQQKIVQQQVVENLELFMLGMTINQTLENQIYKALIMLLRDIALDNVLGMFTEDEKK